MSEIRRPPLATAISVYEFVIAALSAIGLVALIGFALYVESIAPPGRHATFPSAGTIAFGALDFALGATAGALLLQMRSQAVYPLAIKLAFSFYRLIATIRFRLTHPQFAPLQHLRIHSPMLTVMSVAARHAVLREIIFLALNTAITFYVFRITRHSDTPDRAAIQPQSPAAF